MLGHDPRHDADRLRRRIGSQLQESALPDRIKVWEALEFFASLHAVLPTARAAQAVGMLLWFVMLFLGGAGPPPEVLTDAMRAVSDVTPLWHAVQVMHDVWLGLDAGLSWLVFSGFLVVCAAFGLRLFRWE